MIAHHHLLKLAKSGVAFPNCNSHNVFESTLQETKLAFFSEVWGNVQLQWQAFTKKRWRSHGIQYLLVRLVEPTAQPHAEQSFRTHGKVTRHLFSSQSNSYSNASNFHDSPSPALLHSSYCWALLLCEDLVGCHPTGTGETQHRFHLKAACAMRSSFLKQSHMYVGLSLTTVWDCMSQPKPRHEPNWYCMSISIQFQSYQWLSL